MAPHQNPWLHAVCGDLKTITWQGRKCLILKCIRKDNLILMTQQKMFLWLFNIILCVTNKYIGTYFSGLFQILRGLNRRKEMQPYVWVLVIFKNKRALNHLMSTPSHVLLPKWETRSQFGKNLLPFSHFILVWVSKETQNSVPVSKHLSSEFWVTKYLSYVCKRTNWVWMNCQSVCCGQQRELNSSVNGIMVLLCFIKKKRNPSVPLCLFLVALHKVFCR